MRPLVVSRVPFPGTPPDAGLLRSRRGSDTSNTSDTADTSNTADSADADTADTRDGPVV